MKFQLSKDFDPAGDQPAAIEDLVASLNSGRNHQTLLGVTGSGKTFTLANVIERIQRPVLVISHNKTLAAQLYSEFNHFFPDNGVGFFISYYDYYLPEAYLPQTDTYIAKDASINDEIERHRLAATSSLLQRRDVIIVASVSCIYGLGDPDDISKMSMSVHLDDTLDRRELLSCLIDLQYERNDMAPRRGQFRVSGDTIDIYLAYREDVLRIELWEDCIDAMSIRNGLTLDKEGDVDGMTIFPAKQFIMPPDRIETAEKAIREELREQVAKFEAAGKLVEAQRIYQRTNYDLEMLREMGYCSGIENYSRHLSGRAPGSKPYTLLDYFPDDFVTIIDESHASLPQIRGMYNADQSRKHTLVDHGFRLPSALDNRPLNFDEFSKDIGQAIYVSATPGAYEMQHSIPIEQVVRPTGLLDPEIILRPLEGQVDDLIAEVRDAAEREERVLVTTLTKQTSEDLTDYLEDINIRVKYLHSEIDALERVEILRDLRAGMFDCLIGVNLLREGLDLPEVSMVAILDADKEGFLRSETALIQTAGRAARHEKGRVILYADNVTDSMKRMMDLSTDRRQRQMSYNDTHGIVPKTIVRPVQESLRYLDDIEKSGEDGKMVAEDGSALSTPELIQQLETDMFEAAEALEFERAALLRDQIRKLEKDDHV